MEPQIYIKSLLAAAEPQPLRLQSIELATAFDLGAYRQRRWRMAAVPGLFRCH